MLIIITHNNDNTKTNNNDDDNNNTNDDNNRKDRFHKEPMPRRPMPDLRSSEPEPAWLDRCLAPVAQPTPDAPFACNVYVYCFIHLI